jgi:hypothetical protein
MRQLAMKDREKVAQDIKLIATVNGIAAILHIALRVQIPLC